jgi:Ni,Fe-hydrogenase III small subunit
MFALLRDLRRLRRTVDLAPSARGRSLAIRHVDAGSCNACEHELTLTTNPYHDLQRHGLGIVASPRHADLLLVTGSLTTRMREPLLVAYRAMPEPRRVAALGNCALGCHVLGHADALAGRIEDVLPIDLQIPGCPPTPTQIAEALIAFLDRGSPSISGSPSADGASSPMPDTRRRVTLRTDHALPEEPS